MYLWLRAVLSYDQYLSGEISRYLPSKDKMRVSRSDTQMLFFLYFSVSLSYLDYV
jgi:hypothetical protein